MSKNSETIEKALDGKFWRTVGWLLFASVLYTGVVFVGENILDSYGHEYGFLSETNEIAASISIGAIVAGLVGLNIKYGKHLVPKID